MLLLLYGEESFLKLRKLQAIKERYLSLRKEKFYLRTFDCLEVRDASEMLQVIQGASLLLEKKLIVLENLFSSKDSKEKLLEYKDELLNTAHTLVFFEEGEIGEKDTLFLFLKTHGKIQQFSPLTPRRLEAWVQEEFLRYGEKPQLEVAHALIRAAGNDLWRLSQEISKLAAYSKGSFLTKRDIEDLVEPVVSSEIFATVDAISARNIKQALALLAEHEKRGDQPLRILATVGFQFRALAVVKEMADKGFSYDAIVRKTKLHPYVVKKALGAAKNFSLEELTKGLRRIFDTELGLKTGVLEPSSALSWLVLAK